MSRFLIANGSCQSAVNKWFSHGCFSRCLYIFSSASYASVEGLFPWHGRRNTRRIQAHTQRLHLPHQGMAPQDLARILKCLLLCTGERRLKTPPSLMNSPQAGLFLHRKDNHQILHWRKPSLNSRQDLKSSNIFGYFKWLRGRRMEITKQDQKTPDSSR